MKTDMDMTELLRRRLADVPAGSVKTEAGELTATTSGKGLMEIRELFPGIRLSFNDFLAGEIAFRHPASHSVLEIHYCHRGRVGWDMKNGTSVFLGAGDLAVHSRDCCADSVMQFPTGFCCGISLSVDLKQLEGNMPPFLAESGFSLCPLREKYCGLHRSTAISACGDTEAIFAPLYRAADPWRLPWMKLKALELLLFLGQYTPDSRLMTPSSSRQADLIRQIHSLLTEDLSRRCTIEELSRRYLINPSSLKEAFRAVYGLPIAAYMKNYRIRRAMEILRDTDETVGAVAAKMGYESQGKFARAFKDIAGMTPTEYRRSVQRN